MLLMVFSVETLYAVEKNIPAFKHGICINKLNLYITLVYISNSWLDNI